MNTDKQVTLQQIADTGAALINSMRSPSIKASIQTSLIMTLTLLEIDHMPKKEDNPRDVEGYDETLNEWRLYVRKRTIG